MSDKCLTGSLSASSEALVWCCEEAEGLCAQRGAGGGAGTGRTAETWSGAETEAGAKAKAGAKAGAGLEKAPVLGMALSRAQLKAECQLCQAPKARHRCGECGVPHYCSEECRDWDWPRHKKQKCQHNVEHGIEAVNARIKEAFAS